MKKILTLVCTLLLLTAIAFGQDVQKSLHVEEGEFSRCHTVEYNNYLQSIGKKTSDQRFENWMHKNVQSLEKQPIKSTIVYTIPIIVHVIHRGEPEGTGTNISQAVIMDQIEQLNRDFRRMTGTLGFNDHPDGADVMIEFCPALRDEEDNVLPQPGINRINAITSGLGLGIYTIVEFDDVVKRNTFWDPEQYFNFWSADLAAGVILGYAQFPEAPTLDGIGTGNGDAETDGVVCLYSTIGGEDTPGSNAPYDLGRTGTHEVGHWLGLRHIWGDTDCTGDDFCMDTPNAADSNGGCPVVNTCDDSGNPHFGGADPNDMVENYMDYTNDACMNIFTMDQRERMRIVMGETGIGSPRRAILNSSTKCAPVEPWISFVEKSSMITEGTSCSDKTVSIALKIATAPATASTVTFSYAGTATNGTDYSVANTVTFPAGSQAQQTLELDIAEDALAEGAETIEITITAVSGGGQLNAFDLTHSLTIKNDDFEPDMAALQTNVTLIDADFETPANDAEWSIISPIDGVNDWVFGNAITTTNLTRLIHISDNGTTYTYDQLSETRTIIFQEVDATHVSNLVLSFDWACVGEGADGLFDFGEVVYSTDGVNFQRVPGTSALHTQPVMTNATYALPEFLDNTTFFLGFEWENDALVGSVIAPIAIDNVQLTGDRRIPAAIQLSQSTMSDMKYVGANETVYFYNSNSGNIMLAIENGTLPLGCTSVEVSTGFSGSLIDLSAIAEGIEAASKTFAIEPSLNAGVADYKVWLYYTDSEIQNWIDMHGHLVTIDDFTVFKTDAAAVSAANNSNTEEGFAQNRENYNAAGNGEDGYRFSAEFTDGFSLFGGANLSVCTVAANQSFSGSLPVGKTAVKGNATINGPTQANKVYELTAGNSITLIPGAHLVAGSTVSLSIENCTLPVEDFNNSPNVLQFQQPKTAEIQIYPNPFSDASTLEYNLPEEEQITITLYDMQGRVSQTLLSSTVHASGLHQMTIDGASLSGGAYYVQIKGAATNLLERIMVIKN